MSLCGLGIPKKSGMSYGSGWTLQTAVTSRSFWTGSGSFAASSCRHKPKNGRVRAACAFPCSQQIGRGWIASASDHGVELFAQRVLTHVFSSQPQSNGRDDENQAPSHHTTKQDGQADSYSHETTEKELGNSTSTVDGEVDLTDLLDNLNLVKTDGSSESSAFDDIGFCKATSEKFEWYLNHLCMDTTSSDDNLAQALELLSAENVSSAFWILMKCRYEPGELSQRARQWERYLGKLKWTNLTDSLSIRLLIVNAKAGNVGRVLSLLQLREAHSYTARQEEFIHAIRSLKICSLSQHEDGVRNIFLHDSQHHAIDNPTRWLDAILLNMAQRNFPLTTPIANRMIDCYSATGGRTGKAVHHFYRVVRQGILTMSPEEKPKHTDEMPQEWFHVPEIGKSVYQPVKVKVKFNEGSPPFYKVPSRVRGRLLYDRNTEVGELKLEREVEPEYSLPLAAAFAFADSLQHGACGHEPISLDVGSYNALIKACVCRGALWRAMHVLDTTMPAANIVPNTRSYNFLLSGLAAVGDVVTSQEYYLKMHNAGVRPDSYTVSAIVDGLLNMNDIPGAVTVVQDFFNQHSVLPPVGTQSKILELCLAQGMIYEAKRYCYFIQQLWKWEPNQYHDDELIELMRSTQRNPGLQKEALKKMFAYFGEELKDSDFLP